MPFGNNILTISGDMKIKDGAPVLKTYEQRDCEREVIEQIAWLADHGHHSIGAIAMRVYNLAPLRKANRRCAWT